MKRFAFIAAAVALSAGSALAQAVSLDITPEQETTIYSTLSTGGTIGAAPSNVTVAVGTELPREVELREVPATVKVESVRKYRYAVIGGRVVLVDPSSRKIVKVIEKRG